MSKRASIQLHACVPFLLPTISLGSSAGLSPWPTIQLSRDSICARAALSHCPLPGFLREEDYMQARDSFLHSLDFQVHSGTSSSPVMAAAAGGGAMRSSMGPASAFSSLQHPQHHHSSTSSTTAPSSSSRHLRLRHWAPCFLPRRQEEGALPTEGQGVLLLHRCFRWRRRWRPGVRKLPRLPLQAGWLYWPSCLVSGRLGSPRGRWARDVGVRRAAIKGRCLRSCLA